MKSLHLVLAPWAAVLLSSAAFAASIDKVTATPATGARAGEKVTFAVELSEVDRGICGMTMNFGDGKIESLKVKADTRSPVIFEHVYKTAGNYKLEARGKRVENALGCQNKQKFELAVAAAPAPAAKSVVAAPGQCPPDWALKGKVAKNGAFTCTPRKGVKDAKKPEQPLTCPAGTGYFTKGKTLGCEKA